METQKLSLIIISSMSGAGRSTAEQAFEDIGFRVISNLPTTLWTAAVQQTLDEQAKANTSQSSVRNGSSAESVPFFRGLVIGVQASPALPDSSLNQKTLVALRQWDELDVKHIHLVCDDSVLIQRFSTTRRRHPFALDRPLEDGIRAESAFTQELQDQADLVIDTSLLKPKNLIFYLQSWVPRAGRTRLVVGVSSFAFGKGLPREADFIFDARFLRNPHYDPDLRERTGREKVVADYVKKDPDYEGYFGSILDLIQTCLLRFELESKSYLTVGIGCTGGRHRSVTIAENLAQKLDKLGYEVTVQHRDS